MRTQNHHAASLGEVAALAEVEASWRWERVGSASGDSGRIVMAAAIAWGAAYPIAYAEGYTALATRAAIALEGLHRHVGSARGEHRTALSRLVEIAQTARPRLSAAPPLPRRVLKVAAVAVLNRLDGRTAPQAITQAVHREAVIEGGMQGALTAALDINGGWRTRTEEAVLDLPIGEMSLGQSVNTSFAVLNRDFVTNWVAAIASTPVAVVHANFAVAVTASRPSPMEGPLAAQAVEKDNRTQRGR